MPWKHFSLAFYLNSWNVQKKSEKQISLIVIGRIIMQNTYTGSVLISLNNPTTFFGAQFYNPQEISVYMVKSKGMC